MTEEQKLIEVVELVGNEDGLSIEDATELLDVSSRTVGRRLRRAAESGLLERRLDEDGYFFYEISTKGKEFLSQKNSGGNPNAQEVIKVVKLSFAIGDEVASEIKELAEEEELSISEFLEELVLDALDEFYPVEGDEETEEEIEEGR